MKDKTRKRLNTLFIILYIAALAALYFYLYLIPGISGSRQTTDVINYGKLESVNDAACLIIRQEQVVCAEQDGTLSYYCEEGSKTRVGTKILDVYPAGKSAAPYYCQTTGFVSYYIDGYEDYFSVDEIIELEPEYISQTMIAPEDSTRKTCSKDEPLYKLITGEEWYMVLAVDKAYQDDYTIGQSISVRFADSEAPEEEAEEKDKDEKDKDDKDGNEKPAETEVIEDVMEEIPGGYTEIPAQITSVFKKEGGLLVVAKTRRYYEAWARLRFTRVKVVTRSTEGLMIPKTAVAEVDGQPGVYKLGVTGEYSFVPVEIMSTGEEVYVVRSDTIELAQPDGTRKSVYTVGIYDEILRNAEDYR